VRSASATSRSTAEAKTPRSTAAAKTPRATAARPAKPAASRTAKTTTPRAASPSRARAADPAPRAPRAAPERAPRRAAEAPDPNAARIAELEADSAPTQRKRDVVAGPKKRGRADPRPTPSPDRLEELVRAAVASLEDDKAEDVVVLDVATRSAFADRMIVATGLAERQIEAMARHVEEALAEHGIRRIRTEASPDWVLLDAGDVVIHLFKPEARGNYGLERMWGPESPAPEDASMPEPRTHLADDEEGATPDEDGMADDAEAMANEDAMAGDEEDAEPAPEESEAVESDAEEGDAEEGEGDPEEGDAGAADHASEPDVVTREILPRNEVLDGPAGATFGRNPRDEEGQAE
jgi:ribosome silencing factor RsfS/YbeB/iojap